MAWGSTSNVPSSHDGSWLGILPASTAAAQSHLLCGNQSSPYRREEGQFYPMGLKKQVQVLFSLSDKTSPQLIRSPTRGGNLVSCVSGQVRIVSHKKSTLQNRKIGQYSWVILVPRFLSTGTISGSPDSKTSTV